MSEEKQGSLSSYLYPERSTLNPLASGFYRYGLGRPLGLTATIAWFGATWRLLRGQEVEQLLPVLSTGAYFLSILALQSLFFCSCIRRPFYRPPGC